MSIQEEHIQSGVVSISGNIVHVHVSGNVIQSAVSGALTILSGSFIQAFISGGIIQTSVSGNVIQTSISGNVIQASISGDVLVQAIGSTFVAGSVIVPSNSGGIQLPSNPLVVGALVPQQAELSGGATTTNILVGGLGGNAPYNDTTVFPPFNGIFINVIPSNQFIAVNNTNQIRAVAGSGLSGAALRFFGW